MLSFCERFGSNFNKCLCHAETSPAIDDGQGLPQFILFYYTLNLLNFFCDLFAK